MEAAEKIPKKLYVYLDTTRGHRHRHGGQDVHCGRAGDRVRHRCQRGVWAGAVSAGVKEKRTAVPAVLFVFRIKTSDVLLHALGGGVLVRADGDGELHAILLAEAVQPVKERLYRLQVVAAGDLAEIIHEHMGNIVIARVPVSYTPL